MRPIARRIVSLGVTALATALCAPLAARAQPSRSDTTRRDTTAVHADSTAARLARLEAELALLRQQLGDETRSATHTRSRIGLTLMARVQLNLFTGYGRTNSVDVPQVVLAPVTPANTSGTPGTRSFGMSLRQSRVGGAVSVDSVLGGNFQGDIDLDFFGGVSNGPGDRRLFPEPRIRTARGTLVWPHTELMIGSETPLISDLNPISLAAVGFPGFVAVGNLWNWLPQIRVTRDIAGLADDAPVHVALQGAILSPFSGAQNISETDAVDAGERSARPYLETRVRTRWGDRDDAASDGDILRHGGEIGIGAHYGWIRAAGATPLHSQAISADMHIALPGRLELRGEAYRGQLLRGLGGGGIAQNFGRALDTLSVGPPLRDAAGWVQLNMGPHPTFIAGVGCGIDVVNTDDRPARERNTSCAVHALYRPAQPVFMSAEFRTIATRYASGTYRAAHFNLAFGFEL